MSLLSQYVQMGKKQAEYVLADIRPEWIKPTSIHLSITWRCNLNCMQCDIPVTGDRSRPELTTEQICDYILQLKKWLGPYQFNIAGGEPFIRKDLMDIIEFSTRNGVSVNVTTNGMLITEEIATRLEKSGINSLNISLDGFKEETHDRTRNSPGAYRKVMQVIERLNKPRDFCLVISSILMGPNLDEVVDLVDWVEANMLNGIIFQPLFSTFGRPYDPDWWKDNPLFPQDLEKVDAVIDELILGRKQGSAVVNSIRQLEGMRYHFHNPATNALPRCRVDTKNFSINEYGDALLCFWLKPVGNILTTSPKEVWYSMLAHQRRKEIKVCKRNCSLLNCHFD